MKSKLKAFTLVELIISIAIIGILGYILILNTRVISKHQEKSELNIISTSITHTKSSSLSTRQRHYIDIDYENNAYYISVSKEEIKLDSLEFLYQISNTNFLEFTSAGRPAYDTPGTIYLRGKKTNTIYKLTILPVTGKVNITEEGE